MGLFSKIKKLSVFSGFFSIDEDFFDELEESLILADMGMETTMEAVEELRSRVKERKLKEPEDVKACLREILVEMLNVGDAALDLAGKPAVLLMIGVNGVGKTTTIGKLAHLLKGEGNRVLLVAVIVSLVVLFIGFFLAKALVKPFTDVTRAIEDVTDGIEDEGLPFN